MDSTQVREPEQAGTPPAEPAHRGDPEALEHGFDPVFDASVIQLKALRQAADLHPDPLESVLRIEAADLHEFGRKYKSLVDAALEQAKSLADLGALDPAIKRFMDILRQCVQVDQLIHKIHEAEQRREKLH